MSSCRSSLRMLCAVALPLVGAFFPLSTASGMTFDRPRPLNGNAYSDATAIQPVWNDSTQSVVSSGGSSWVALWQTKDPLLGAGPVGDLVYAQSSDDGRTWTYPVLVDQEAASVDARGGRIARDVAGTMVVAEGAGQDLRFMRSVNGGSTWSFPVSIDGGGDLTSVPAVAGDGAGHWVAVWAYSSGGPSNWQPLAHSVSSDDGQTWSAATVGAIAGVEEDVANPWMRLATDNAGTWMVSWTGILGNTVAVSIDNGISWGTPVVVGQQATASGLATDGTGVWVSAWIENYAKLMISRSINNGATWTSPAEFGASPDAGGSLNNYSSFSVDVGVANGVWRVVWGSEDDRLGNTIGREGDLLGVRSLDGGVTWTDPAALNVNAQQDNAAIDPNGTYLPKNWDSPPALAHSDEGTVLLTWSSTNSLDNSVGNDIDILYARSHDDCPLTPTSGCRTSTTPGASSLTIKNPVGGRDSLQWNWRSGQETSPVDLGDPTMGTSYVLCLYDKAGPSVRSVLELDAASGTTCKKGPCWAASGEGFRYGDTDRRNGPIRSVSIAPGADGRSALQVKAAGPALAPPVMPLAIAPSVKVQLVNTENNECWESTFSSADTNTATLFQAHSD